MFIWSDKTENEILQGAKRSYAFLEEDHERLGIPNPALTLKEPLDAFDAALSRSKDPDSGMASTVSKKAAKKAMKDAFRAYGNEYLAYNRLVTAW
jgi:hypothetical protein